MLITDPSYSSSIYGHVLHTWAINRRGEVQAAMDTMALKLGYQEVFRIYLNGYYL